MNKYVSPIIEIEKVEVEDIICSIDLGDDELPPIILSTDAPFEVPASLEEYFN